MVKHRLLFSSHEFWYPFDWLAFHFLDSLIVAVKPKPPVKSHREGLDDDEDDEDLV